MEFTIDAQGKSIGRIATEAAHILMGKNSPAFARNKIVGSRVRIINAAKVTVTEKKKSDTKYARYSGYPGGFRYENMEELVAKKGMSAVLERAVAGMIPNNKLKKDTLKLLVISE